MIDMQNTYLPGDEVRDALGWPPIWRLDEVVRECADLLGAARRQGLPVVYSRAVDRRADADRYPQLARFLAARSARMPQVRPERARWARGIMDAVAPQPGDAVLDKTRHSFFDYTELEPLLRSLGVTRLVVAGLQTNVCVEGTVRAAIARNFDVAVPEDAVSTDGPALHAGALDAMRVLLVEVAPWRELIAPGAR